LGGGEVAEGQDERLAVLRMVATAAVTPEEGLALLDALAPEGPVPAGAPVPLRLRLELGGNDTEFALSAAPGARLGDVVRDALGMLPDEARDAIPDGLLQSTLRIGSAPDDRLVHLERETPGGWMDLTIERQRFRFHFNHGEHVGFVPGVHVDFARGFRGRPR
jgi:hypothetical protein